MAGIRLAFVWRQKNHMKRIIQLSIVLALSVALSSCGLGLSRLTGGGGSASKQVKATHTPPAPVNAITIVDGKFRPKNAMVKLGTTVTWTNTATKPESVTSDAPGLFDSGTIAPGATWQHTFDKAGVYPYHSTGGSGVYGSVTVNP